MVLLILPQTGTEPRARSLTQDHAERERQLTSQKEALQEALRRGAPPPPSPAAAGATPSKTSRPDIPTAASSTSIASEVNSEHAPPPSVGSEQGRA